MKPTARVLFLSAAMLAQAVPAQAQAQAPAQNNSFYPLELGSLSSVASIQDASALGVNPAALAFQNGSELFLSRSVNGLEQTNLFLTGGGFGSAWQQFRTPGGRFLNDFRLGASLDVLGGLALGGSFDYLQFLDAQSGNSANFGLSAIYRPTGWLSLGATAYNLTEPPIGTGFLSRTYRAGLAIRPFKDRLTLSLDGLYNEGQPASSITPWAGAQLELWPGCTLRGMVDNQLDYSLGLAFDFGQVSTGFMSGVTSGRVGPSDLIYATTSDLWSRDRLELGRAHLAYVRLAGSLADKPSGPFDLRTEFYPGVLHLTERIAQAKADPKIDGLVLDLAGTHPGLGHLQELYQAIADFKTSGKTVVAYVEDASIGEYFLATAADKIVMHPSGQLDLTGVAETVPFFRGVLDKLGIRPQFVGFGKYKSAPEQYMRKDFSAPGREEADVLVGDQFDQMITAIAKARRLSHDEVRNLVDRGLFSPQAAKEKGLVDTISYPDQVPGMVQKGPAPTYPLHHFKPRTWAHPPIIAVVSVDGAIARGTSGSDLLEGATVGSENLTHALREARKDDDVKAVVIRVDSPGGDSLASDEIGREIDLLRLSNKPVIVSMGNVAASGGYWVSATGQRIYAEPGTITGSIGVYTGQFSFDGLLDKVGVTTETIKRGTHADMGEGYRAATPQEMDMLRDQARYTYEQFLNRVSQGRKLSVSRVDQIAQGRVWSGERALDLGLVDKIGGLADAIEDARKAAKLDPDTVQLAFLPRLGLIENINDSNMNELVERTIKAADHYQQLNTWMLMPPVPQAK